MTRQQQLELHPLHVTSVSAAVRWALEMPQSLHRGTEGARTKTRLPWMRVTHVFTEFQQKRPPLLHPPNPNSNIFLLLVLLYPHHAGAEPAAQVQTAACKRDTCSVLGAWTPGQRVTITTVIMDASLRVVPVRMEAARRHSCDEPFPFKLHNDLRICSPLQPDLWWRR